MLPLYRILGNFSFNLNYLSLYVFLLIDTRYVLLTVATTLAEIITLMVLLLMICYYNNNIIITAKVFQHLRKLVFLNRRTSSQIITVTMVNSRTANVEGHCILSFDCFMSSKPMIHVFMQIYLD